ncbi:uncharacterized protein LOC128668710 isoform X2 [Microplitis demolitor]|uniref:uncharacterized protein LOC103578708 isoform X2 n=1 Tax=Microplitis demolitor TaxID=69319 RepID=UPI0006D4F30C|nr:uncharacterized protein LOC103578708 isoform X2 [Microplitis demolitor]XP_053596185.1 uncharacterized protein LOC128668049 isoform X2 [Microplitis demolitor]XP_053598115.1 uncharacterized protein LOC128668710 isoform X2 [Microplitis demolitor]
MKKFALVSSSKDDSNYYIIETRFIYKVGSNGGIKLIQEEDIHEDDLFVRKIGLHLSHVSIIDIDDDPYKLRKNYSKIRRIRMQRLPQYSPNIPQKKTVREIKKNAEPNASRATIEQTVEDVLPPSILPDSGTKTRMDKNTEPNASKAAIEESAQYYLNMLPPSPIANPSNETEIDEENETTVTMEPSINNTSNPEQLRQALADVTNNTENSNNRSQIRSDETLSNSSSTLSRRSLNSQTTRVNSQSNPRSSHHPFTRRTFIPRLQLSHKKQTPCKPGLYRQLQRLETKVDKLADIVKTITNENFTVLNTNVRRRYPKLRESTVVVNNKEMYVIDGTHISAEDYAKLVQAPTMRKRVNRIINILWEPEKLVKMYMKPDVKDPLKIVVTPEEKKKVRDLSLYIQKKRELNIAKNGNDDIERFLDKWMGEYFKECRRQAKK